MKVISLDIFRMTMTGLEKALLVSHIATFNLQNCDIKENTESVLRKYEDLDQIPVADDNRIVGVLEKKNDIVGGLVKENMRRLDDSILISSEEPLANFLKLMNRKPYYRLVLKNARIQGIVTRSDILKLPVRLLTFMFVTNLEIILSEIIQEKFNTSINWMDLLSEQRRGKILEKYEELQKQRVNPPLIECAEFCDKRNITKKILKLSNKFKEDLEDIEKLRNQVAHAGNYAENDEQLTVFLQRLNLAEYWISELSGKYL